MHHFSCYKIWGFRFLWNFTTSPVTLSLILALVTFILSKQPLVISPGLNHYIMLSDACKHKSKDDLLLCFLTSKQDDSTSCQMGQ